MNKLQRAAGYHSAMAAIQMSFTDRVIELPKFLTCNYHGEYAPRYYYDDSEIVEMIDGQGFIDCTICLVEIVGIEGL